MSRSVGEVLVSALKARGVEVVFGIPGAHTIELYRGLAGSGIRHVTARHEGSAVFMADGYARVTGKPGVALVITGPGVTNALTAMGQAAEDSVPVLVISGVNRRDSLGRGLGHLHELPDQGGMVRTLCPSFQVTGPEALNGVVDQAFAAMTGGRPGPVHIEVPTDVMPLPCPIAPSTPMEMPPLAPDSDHLAEAARLLNGARQPVIIAGGGARFAVEEVRALAKRLDAPVIQTMNARGLMGDDPLGISGGICLPSVTGLINSSDAVLALGTEIGETEYDAYASGQICDLGAMIRVDVCPAQLARRPARMKIRADARAVARALLPLVTARQTGGAARAKDVMKAAEVETAGLSPEFGPALELLEALRAAKPGAIIVGDSTAPVYAGNLAYRHDRPSGWFNSSAGFGSLGYAPGAAVGAALGAPGVPVICLIGDGGLQFSPSELRTAVDERLPITFLVWNNAGFGEIEKYMVSAGTEVIGCRPSPFRHDHLAAACDLPFRSVGLDAAALKEALLALGPGPALVEIRAT
ncbi:MAG: 5-guanidino-2-oxopentanoate decarboxylase [Paracoccaceae bacterium]